MSFGAILGQNNDAQLQAHIEDKNNPHNVTASQVKALSVGGGH